MEIDMRIKNYICIAEKDWDEFQKYLKSVLTEKQYDDLKTNHNFEIIDLGISDNMLAHLSNMVGG